MSALAQSPLREHFRDLRSLQHRIQHGRGGGPLQISRPRREQERRSSGGVGREPVKERKRSTFNHRRRISCHSGEHGRASLSVNRSRSQFWIGCLGWLRCAQHGSARGPQVKRRAAIVLGRTARELCPAALLASSGPDSCKLRCTMCRQSAAAQRPQLAPCCQPVPFPPGAAAFFLSLVTPVLAAIDLGK